MIRNGMIVLVASLLVIALGLQTPAHAGNTGDTRAIGGPANPAAQTGWWQDIPSRLGSLYVHKADLVQVSLQNKATLVVGNPEILKSKGVSGIAEGSQFELIRVNDNTVKIKVLPNGPTKQITLE